MSGDCEVDRDESIAISLVDTPVRERAPGTRAGRIRRLHDPTAFGVDRAMD
jgi:hypothetical protein